MKPAISPGRWSNFLALGASLLSAICMAAQSPTFTVHVLGNISGGISAYVTGINNAGDAVGEVTGTTVCAGHCAVVWQAGAPTLLGAVAGAMGSTAYSVNTAGQVSGIANMSPSIVQGVIWNNGIPTLLDAPSSQYISTYGIFVNRAGHVVGSTLESQNRKELPIVWDGPTPTVLGIVSGYTTGSASGINNSGVIVGSVCCDLGVPEAVMWSGTTPSLLPRLQASQSGPAAIGGQAVAVNNLGLIVGHAAPATDLEYAVAWENGVVTDLGWIGAGSRAAPAAVNDQGIIVGESATEAGAIEHAALWSRVGAAPQDLNSLISAAQAEEFEITGATGINDNCTITANGLVRKTSANVALLLTLIDAANCVNGL
jgi:probable HAF family extracellular repeat protein